MGGRNIMKKVMVVIAGVALVSGALVLYPLAPGSSFASPSDQETVVPVASDIFDAIGYQEARGTLTLSFREGYRYEYYDVPPACYYALVRAACKGAYFNRQIRGRFACVRVDAPRG